MSVWSRHRWTWLGPLLFAVGGMLLLGFYYLALNGKARALESRLQDRIEVRDQLLGELATATAAVDRLAADDARVAELFGTIEDVPRRMTRYVRLVHELTKRAGVNITGGVGFGGEEIEEFGLAERSMNFEIRGDYNSLRRFINMLELSDAFLALRDIRVTIDRDTNVLRAGLSVSTLFAAEGAPTPQVAAPEAPTPEARAPERGAAAGDEAGDPGDDEEAA